MWSTISKAWLGLMALRMMPNRPIPAVSRIPPYGTPVFDIGAVNLGPLPLIAIDRRIRPVEYSPALRLDSAAVSTTRFITLPAASIPILEKKVTNGLTCSL